MLRKIASLITSIVLPECVRKTEGWRVGPEFSFSVRKPVFRNKIKLNEEKE